MTTDVLANLSPRDQLRAGRLPRRLVQLAVGLWLYGTSMAMMIRSGLGLDPWDVFHSGLTDKTGMSFGAIVTIIGALVLLLWIPLRQMPGLGTVANVLVIGVATDVGLWLMPIPESMLVRVLLILGGIVLNGLAGALYIGAQLGTGPRDGLMTGIARRSGFSLRLVRTAIEVSVLVIGFALGGVVGVGTVLYAIAIGPLVQKMLPWFAVTLAPPGAPNGCVLREVVHTAQTVRAGARHSPPAWRAPCSISRPSSAGSVRLRASGHPTTRHAVSVVG